MSSGILLLANFFLLIFIPRTWIIGLSVTYLEDNYCFQSLLVPNSIGIPVCVDFYSYSFDSQPKHSTLTTEYASLIIGVSNVMAFAILDQ